MSRTIIHVDMDAFYAAVEVRDNPELRGKPLIIGALPSERGVVSTCSYEARKFGVRSAMSIKEAYRRCPHGIYMHPNMHKYYEASQAVRKIWGDYTDLIEYISLDEGYLDVTASMHLFGGAMQIATEIKKRTLENVGLTCSVGIGYSMSTAKLASEEKKPNGLFEIPNAEFFMNLGADRTVRTLSGIGEKTAEKLNQNGIYRVRDIWSAPEIIIVLLGKHGQHIVELSHGIDNRPVVPYFEEGVKSISREHTFQTDITDTDYLKDVLILLARELSCKLRFSGLYCRTVTLKVTFANMKSITRSKSGNATNRSQHIYATASELLDKVEKRAIRLVGIGLSTLSETDDRQLSLDDIANERADSRRKLLDKKLLDIQRKYGNEIIKTAAELGAEQRLSQNNRENPSR